MKVVLEKAGKKFYREWIFRNLDLTISTPEKVAILGPNGSGKSTLLQLISGAVMPSSGKVSYYDDTVEITPELIFRQVGFAAPYLDLIDEFTLEEIIKFNFKFKKVAGNLSLEEVIDISGLQTSRKKVFKYFSSGMKQKLKLVLALLSEVDLVLLDEPCSNLDKVSIKWYQDLVHRYTENKLVVICSNTNEDEFSICKRHLNVTDWK